jgi:hypothetical protein
MAETLDEIIARAPLALQQCLVRDGARLIFRYLTRLPPNVNEDRLRQARTYLTPLGLHFIVRMVAD